MDVILDSNIFLSDIRMESIGFKNLFDYLRRTGSKLVIPHLVREEVVHRHAERLCSEGKKALKAIGNFNRLVLQKNRGIHFSIPDPKHERPVIRKKFSEFPKGVIVELYRDLDNINIQELYLRGITRKRPANVNGEELRDVILWMIAMQYSVTKKRETAFITRDGGFWEGEDLHEQIRRDIEDSKAPLTVFPTIDSFIKQSAPPPRKATSEEVEQVFDLGTLHKELIAALSGAFRKAYTSSKLEWQLGDSKMTSAVIYDIDEQTAFAEVTYALEAFVESTTWVYPMAEPGLGLFGQGQLAPAPLNPFSPLSAMLNPQPHNLFSGFAQPTAGPKAVNRRHAVIANVRVLLRILNKKVSEAEIDSVSIAKREDVEAAAAVTVAPKS
jgi:PIN domain